MKPGAESATALNWKRQAAPAACHQGIINADLRSPAVDFGAAERQENRRRANGMV